MNGLRLSLILGTIVLAFAASAAAGNDNNSVGAAYTISNAAAGNALVVYSRSADGSLAPAGSVSAGGLGTGGGLASQGAVTVTHDGRPGRGDPGQIQGAHGRRHGARS